MIENIIEVQLYKTKYILCNEVEYAELNELISAASGYPDKTGTNIYAPLVPVMSACVYAKDIDGKDTEVLLEPSKCVLPIVADLQEYRQELILGFDLVNSYTHLEIFA
jgi:hypothetical protein